MEIGQDLKKFTAVESVQKHGKLTECNRALVKMLGFLDYVIPLCTFYENVNAIAIAFHGTIISISAFGHYKRKTLPVGISASCDYLGTIEFGNEFNVVHKSVDVFEQIGVYTLNYISHFFTVFVIYGNIGSVNKSAAVGLAIDKFAFNRKIRQ